jgi:hypothetical protein
MNPLVCALTLVLSCGSKPAAMLNVSHAAIAFADTYYTQRSYDLCRVMVGCRDVEANTLTRPIQREGKPIAFQATLMGVSLTAFAAQKMRTSRNRMVRRLWWLPQAALIGGSIYGAQSQARYFGPVLARCGTECASALGR